MAAVFLSDGIVGDFCFVLVISSDSSVDITNPVIGREQKTLKSEARCFNFVIMYLIFK